MLKAIIKNICSTATKDTLPHSQDDSFSATMEGSLQDGGWCFEEERQESSSGDLQEIHQFLLLLQGGGGGDSL